MSLTIIVSGPKASVTQARNALAAAQFDVQNTDHDYGLPPESDQQAEAFVTCTGDDIDKAHDSVSSLGWRLRMHYPTPEPSPPSEADRLSATLAEMQGLIAQQRAELDALKARV